MKPVICLVRDWYFHNCSAHTHTHAHARTHARTHTHTHMHTHQHTFTDTFCMLAHTPVGPNAYTIWLMYSYMLAYKRVRVGLHTCTTHWLTYLCYTLNHVFIVYTGSHLNTCLPYPCTAHWLIIWYTFKPCLLYFHILAIWLSHVGQHPDWHTLFHMEHVCAVSYDKLMLCKTLFLPFFHFNKHSLTCDEHTPVAVPVAL